MEAVRIEFQEKVNLTKAIATGNLVAFNGTCDREIIVAIARKPLDYRHSGSSGASFAKSKTEQGQKYSIFYTVCNELIHLTDIANEVFNIHEVQFLSDRQILLVCCRANYYGRDRFDRNGRIYSTSGEYQTGILLGDGIQNVRVSSKGTIWTSYFDEGIFGNRGWHTLGMSGLAAWNADGEKIYEFSPVGEIAEISDCYALNVETNNITWCYYYTDFPLVRIDRGCIDDYWYIPVYGSDCFAVYRNFALFRGGYKERNCFYLVKLGKNHRATIEKRIQPVNIENIDRISSCGDTIFYLSAKKVYSISVYEAMYV